MPPTTTAASDEFEDALHEGKTLESLCSTSTEAMQHLGTLTTLIKRLRERHYTAVSAYRQRVLRLTEELEAARSRDISVSLEGSTTPVTTSAKAVPPPSEERFSRASAVSKSWSSSLLPMSSSVTSSSAAPSSSCHCGSSAQCLHKELLASHIVDRTFDEHTRLLRTRLKEAHDELAALRNGSLLHSKQAEIAELRQQVAEERSRSAELQSTVGQLKVENMMLRQQERAARLGYAQNEEGATVRRKDSSRSAELNEAKHAMAECTLVSSLGHMEACWLASTQWSLLKMALIAEHLGASSDQGANRKVEDPSEQTRIPNHVPFATKFKPQAPPHRTSVIKTEDVGCFSDATSLEKHRVPSSSGLRVSRLSVPLL